MIPYGQDPLSPYETTQVPKRKVERFGDNVTSDSEKVSLKESREEVFTVYS